MQQIAQIHNVLPNNNLTATFGLAYALLDNKIYSNIIFDNKL